MRCLTRKGCALFALVGFSSTARAESSEVPKEPSSSTEDVATSAVRVEDPEPEATPKTKTWGASIDTIGSLKIPQVAINGGLMALMRYKLLSLGAIGTRGTSTSLSGTETYLGGLAGASILINPRLRIDVLGTVGSLLCQETRQSTLSAMYKGTTNAGGTFSGRVPTAGLRAIVSTRLGVDRSVELGASGFLNVPLRNQTYQIWNIEGQSDGDEPPQHRDYTLPEPELGISIHAGIAFGR